MLTINLVPETPEAVVGLSGANILIIDDEEQKEATIEFSDAEYHPADGFIKVTVKRDGAINQVVSVKLVTDDETAQKDRDYSQVDTTLVFPYGMSERTINIPIRSDYAEENASFKLKLYNPTSCEIGELDTARGIIDAQSESYDFKGTAYETEDDSDVQLMADATASDVILGDKVDMKTFFNNMKVHLGGQVIKSGDEYTLTLPKMYYFNAIGNIDPFAEISASTGEHYDYSGYQIEWTKESEAGNYSHTVTSAGTDVVSNEERWSRRKTNIFTNSISSSSFSVRLYYDEALLSTETKLTVHSVAPILRPFEVSLVPSDPLKFLNENGDYVDNTNIARLKNANDVVFQNASTNGKGTAIKFSGDYITVTTNSPYSYISGLNIVDPDTGRSTPILTGLKPGTTSASVQLTNDFITSNLYYINFADNNKNGKKGQIKIQAVLDYYDVDVNIHEDPNASVTMTEIRDPEEEDDSHIIRGDFYIKSASTGKYIYLDDPTFSYPKDVILKNGWGTKFTVTPSYLYPQGGQFDDLGVIKMSDWPNSALTLRPRSAGETGPTRLHQRDVGANPSMEDMFSIAKQDDGTYTLVAGKYFALKDCGDYIGRDFTLHPETLTSSSRWILEPAEPEPVKVWSLHRGDTVTFTQNVTNPRYKSSRIRFVTRDTSTAEEVDVKRKYDKDNSCTLFCDYASMDVYPSYENSMQVIVRVNKDDLSMFRRDKGIFTCPSVESGRYIDYIVTNEDEFAESVYFEYSAYAKSDNYVPLWNGAYAQNTFYFQTSSNPDWNLMTLTCQKADSQKYVLTGKARYSDTSINGTTEGSAWMPAKGAYVLMGSSVYGISDGDGNLTTIGAPGIAGRRVIYKTVASGMTRYATATLSNRNTVEYQENTYDPVTGDVTGTVTQSAYGVDLGMIIVSPTDRTAPYPEAFVATTSEGIQTDTVQINDDITNFEITINNNHAKYTDTDGVEREEKVKDVEALIYNGQTNEERTVLSGATQVSDENGMSVWHLSKSFERGKIEEYQASDKVYVRITTDRVIGNGKGVDADGNATNAEALQETVYAPIYTGYTLAQSNVQQPVTQDIDPKPNLSFISLPLIGAMNSTFNVSAISLSISELPNGGQRLSFGISPSPISAGSDWKTAVTGVNYGIGDLDDALRDTKTFGQLMNGFGDYFGESHSLAMKEFSIKPIFGLYLDFGLKSVSMGGGTKTTFVFMGGGLYLGGSGKFRGTIYFTIGWLPMYLGFDGELTIFTQVGVQTLNNGADVIADMITKESNTFERYFKPAWCLQANVVVAVYAGVGLCGTVGVRGGFQLDMNFMCNPTITLVYPNFHTVGAVLDFSFRLWVDALLFSIPIPVLHLVQKRYGYYEDMANSDAEGGTNASPSSSEAQLTSADGDSEVVMRPRSENQSEWLPYGDANLMSTFEETSSTVLKENGYDRADSQLLDLGGGRILLAFIADDPTRSDSDRTALMYSVYENGTWSEPVKVQDDGTADFEPDLCDADDNVLITWTSRDKNALTETELDYIKGMDVYAVTLDKATLTLGTIERLTDDTDKSLYDSAPVGLYDDESGDMLVYYLKSEVTSSDFETAVMPTKNESVIVYMLYDAEKDEWLRDYYYPNEVASEEAKEELINNWGGQRFLSSPIKDFSVNSPVIIDFDAVSYNGIGLYTFTVDQDNNLDTDADRELFVQAYDFGEHKTYVPVRITNDALSDARPQLVRNGDYTYLFWLENNKDIRYINVTDLIKYGVDENGTIKEDYKLNIGVVFFADSGDSASNIEPSFGSYKAFVDKDSNLFITWLQPVMEEDGTTCQEVYASAYIQDNDGSCWSDGVRLTHSGAQNDEVAFLTDDDCNLLTVGNQYTINLQSDENKAENVKLVATSFKTVGSLDVTDMRFADDTPPAGSENNVTISVKNTGLKNAKGYTMDVYEKINGEVGEKIKTITSDEVITPSSTVSTEFTWTMPESYEGVDDLSLYIKVNESGTEEIHEFTSDSVYIRPEYTVSNCEAVEHSDGFYLTYTLENTGNADAAAETEETADKLSVEFNDLYYQTDKSEPYLETPVSGLAVGEKQTYTMKLNIPDERFNFGYSEAYTVIKNKDGDVVSNYEPFRVMLEYPYNIVINGDELLSEIVLKEGESLELNAEYSPKEFYADGNIVYSVDDTSVARMDGNKLIAESEGETTLTAIVDPYGGYKTVKVTVEPKKSGKTHSSSSSSGATPKPTEAPEATPAPSPDATQSPDMQGGTVTGETHTYNDVAPNDWFSASVEYATEKGYFSGVSDTEFEPYTNITRGMLITVIGRMAKANPESTDMTYTDVNKNMYYAPYIAWGTENGIVSGYSDTEFAPDELVTREQVAAMLYRYAKYINADVSVGEETNILSYKDADKISEYAIPAIQWACGSGIMSGYTDGTLRPQNNATRAEAAALTERFDNKIK